MQTVSIILPQVGASGQARPPLPGSGQGPFGDAAKDDGFLAVLTSETDTGNEPEAALVQAAGNGFLPVVPTALAVGLSSSVSVPAKAGVPDAVDDGLDLVPVGSGQVETALNLGIADVPILPSVSVAAAPEAERKGVSLPAAGEIPGPDLARGAVADPETALSAVAGPAGSPDDASPSLVSATNRLIEGPQVLSRLDALPPPAAEPDGPPAFSSRSPVADPVTVPGGRASVSAQAVAPSITSAGDQAEVAMQSGTSFKPAAVPGSAAPDQTALAQNGTVGSTMPDLGAELPSAVGGLRSDQAFGAANAMPPPDAPKAPEGGLDQGPTPHEVAVPLAALEPASPARGLVAGLVTSAAESLWHGATLARLAATGASWPGPADPHLPGVTAMQGAASGRSASAEAIDTASLLPGSGAWPAMDSSEKGEMPLWQTAASVVTPGPGHLDKLPDGPLPTLPPDAPDRAAMSAFDGLLAVANGEVQPSPELAVIGGATAGAAPAAPLSATFLPTGPQPLLSPALLSGQIVAGLVQHPGGSTTDIALSPAELGRVQMTLQVDALNPDRMVVFLSFDRPETMDLFRRHADQLVEAIRTAGYAEADINFGQPGTGAGGGSGPGANGRGEQQGDGSERHLQGSPNPLQSNANSAVGSGSSRPVIATALDLRL